MYIASLFTCHCFLNDLIYLLVYLATQQKLLSVCAERSEDTMEHCRLVLLLLNRFPQSSTELAVRLKILYCSVMITL